MSLHFFSAAFRPADEAERQQAVRSIAPIAADDAALREVLEETCRVLRTPIAMLTLTDGDVQRMVGVVGMPAIEVPRAIAFCSHTIATTEGLLTIPDLRADPRFAANPLVCGGPRARHYTGVAVRIGPFPVGALCGIDTRPHGPASFRQRADLRRLAEVAARRLRANPPPN